MKPADLHLGHLVPINGHWWAIGPRAYWMVRTDQLDKRIKCMDSAGGIFSLAEAKPEATQTLLCTLSRQLVLFPNDEQQHPRMATGKKLLDAVPTKAWAKSRFLVEDQFGTPRLLLAHGTELAAVDPAYYKLMSGAGEWRAEGPREPFFRVDGTETVAVLMPVVTDLKFTLPVEV